MARTMSDYTMRISVREEFSPRRSKASNLSSLAYKYKHALLSRTMIVDGWLQPTMCLFVQHDRASTCEYGLSLGNVHELIGFQLTYVLVSFVWVHTIIKHRKIILKQSKHAEAKTKLRCQLVYLVNTLI